MVAGLPRYFGGLPRDRDYRQTDLPRGKVSATGARECFTLWETCPQAIDGQPTLPIGSPMIRGNGISGAIGKAGRFPPIKSATTPSDTVLFSSRGFTVNLSTMGRGNHTAVSWQPSETDTMKPTETQLSARYTSPSARGN